MADYIYSELINNLVSLNFDGVSNENAEIHVDNLHRLIEAIIKKTPGALSIVDANGKVSTFDGSQNITITLSDKYLKSVTLKQCEENNVPIEGLLVGDYYLDFEMNNKGLGITYHIYCSLPETFTTLLSYSDTMDILTSITMPEGTIISNNTIMFPEGVEINNHNINL